MGSWVVPVTNCWVCWLEKSLEGYLVPPFVPWTWGLKQKTELLWTVFCLTVQYPVYICLGFFVLGWWSLMSQQILLLLVTGSLSSSTDLLLHHQMTKGFFSTETLLCESWKNIAFSHLAPANKLKLIITARRGHVWIFPRPSAKLKTVFLICINITEILNHWYWFCYQIT